MVKEYLENPSTGSSSLQPVIVLKIPEFSLSNYRLSSHFVFVLLTMLLAGAKVRKTVWIFHMSYVVDGEILEETG